MAKTIDDYDNFINLLSNPENFRVYSIDDSIKTTTNISSNERRGRVVVYIHTYRSSSTMYILYTCT